MNHDRIPVRALRERIRGTVLSESSDLERYARDRSIYRVLPAVVVCPAGVEDIVSVLALARDAGVPVTARGGGSGTAGAALGAGIVLAFEKDGPMGSQLAVTDSDGEIRAIAAPGVLHDRLQRALGEHGYRLPADPSSGGLSLIGGNIATKASGPHALKHGSIDRYLRSVSLVLADGTVCDTAREESIPSHIRTGLLRLREEILADEVSRSFLGARRGMKSASGYNLGVFLRHENPAAILTGLLAGSVGTLGVVTEAILGAEPVAPGRASTLLFFRSAAEAGDAAAAIRDFGVAAIEIMNAATLAMIRSRRPDIPLPAGDSHMLLVEHTGPERHDTMSRVHRLVDDRAYDLAVPVRTVDGEAEQEALWKVRKALLPMLSSYRPDRVAPSLVNDVGVHPADLARFIGDVERIFAAHGLEAAIYGHAGSGNLHLRPFFDPRLPDLPRRMKALADEVYGCVVSYGGTITGEHGMGRLRAPYLTAEWGEGLVGYMRRVKDLLDPEGVLNPGAVFADGDWTTGMALP